MSSSPLMRVSYMRETVAALSQLAPQHADVVRAQCAAQIARIEKASRLSFLAVDDNLAILKSIEACAGPKVLRSQARAALLAASSGTLLRPIRDAALKMLGATPAGIFRWAPHTWGLVFRDCGTLSWEHTDGAHAHEGVLRLSDLPPLLDCAAWAETSAGAFEGGFDLAGSSSGSVEMAREPSAFRFLLRW